MEYLLIQSLAIFFGIIGFSTNWLAATYPDCYKIDLYWLGPPEENTPAHVDKREEAMHRKVSVQVAAFYALAYIPFRLFVIGNQEYHEFLHHATLTKWYVYVFNYVAFYFVVFGICALRYDLGNPIRRGPAMVRIGALSLGFLLVSIWYGFAPKVLFM